MKRGFDLKKRIFALAAAFALLLLAGCEKKEPAETTAPPETMSAPTATETPGGEQDPTLEEMSPPSLSTAMPTDVPKTYAAVDKSGFKPIKKEDSRWPETNAKSVYRSGNSEYYIMDGGFVFVLTIDDETGAAYSAYYDQDGRLTFFGDDEKNWFFTENGSFDYMMFTYTAPGGAPVVSFYEGEGSRFAVYAGGTYYDGSLVELSGAEQVRLVTRVAAGFTMMGGVNS